MKTFRAADGRLVRARMSEEQIADMEMVKILTILMPLAAVLVFALAAGLI
jgi:hypothetical protein